MRRIRLLILFSSISSLGISQSNNVGINTSEPAQKLHIAGSESTFRIEMLDSLNNLSNRNMTNAPLYVDENGILTLEFDLLHNTENDEIDGTISSSNIFQINVDTIDQELFTKEIIVTRPSYLEVKYSISFEVSLNDNLDKITDQLARVIRNYILLNGSTNRKYGMTSKCYINASLDGVNTTYYNNASTYIFLDVGTHIISFYGSVGSGSTTDSTFVNFGLDQDMLLLRIY